MTQAFTLSFGLFLLFAFVLVFSKWMAYEVQAVCGGQDLIQDLTLHLKLLTMNMNRIIFIYLK